MTEKQITARLEYLRTQIDNECISYGEIAELESLAEHIEHHDIQLLQWTGEPEFGDTLLCTHDNCNEIQIEDGEFCQKHMRIAISTYHKKITCYQFS